LRTAFGQLYATLQHSFQQLPLACGQQCLIVLEKQQAACLTHLEELAMKNFAREISLLCSIPGIQKLSAMLILSEIGNDMSKFPNASALVGWAGLRP